MDIINSCSDCRTALSPDFQGYVKTSEANPKPKELRDLYHLKGDPPPNGFVVLNFFVVVCNQCASCHRSLGRHVSKVRRCSTAHANSLFNTLGPKANAILEATVQPEFIPQFVAPINEKLKFITAKYRDRSYVQRAQIADSPTSTEASAQSRLIMGVVNQDVVAVFSALCCGTDPNAAFASAGEDKPGPTALHIAAAIGNLDIVELLLLHDANASLPWCSPTTTTPPTTPASSTITTSTPLPTTTTAVDLARANGHLDVAARLTEAASHLINTLREWSQAYSVEREPSFLASARKHLDSVAPLELESLSVDLYDEIDRRSLDKIWKTTVLETKDKLNSILTPFLPIISSLPIERQQARQKIATLNHERFTCVVADTVAVIDSRTSVVTNDDRVTPFLLSTSPMVPPPTIIGAKADVDVDVDVDVGVDVDGNVDAVVDVDVNTHGTEMAQPQNINTEKEKEKEQDMKNKLIEVEELVARLKAENFELRTTSSRQGNEIIELRAELARTEAAKQVAIAKSPHTYVNLTAEDLKRLRNLDTNANKSNDDSNDDSNNDNNNNDDFDDGNLYESNLTEEERTRLTSPLPKGIDGNQDEIAHIMTTATQSIQHLFSAAKLGEVNTIIELKSNVAHAVTRIVNYVEALNTSQTPTKLIASVEMMKQKQQPRDIMLQAYAIAQEINKLTTLVATSI